MDMSDNPLHASSASNSTNTVGHHDPNASKKYSYDSEEMEEGKGFSSKMRKRMSTVSGWLSGKAFGNSFDEDEIIEDVVISDDDNDGGYGGNKDNFDIESSAVDDNSIIQVDKNEDGNNGNNSNNSNDSSNHHRRHRHHHSSKSTLKRQTSKPLPQGATVEIVIGPDGKKRRVVYITKPRSTRRKVTVWSAKIVFAIACIFAGLYLAYVTELADVGLFGGSKIGGSNGNTGGGNTGSEGGGGNDDDNDDDDLSNGGGVGRYTPEEIKEMLAVCACPADIAFLTSLLLDDSIDMTPDLTLSEYKASIYTVDAIPIVTLVSGVITSKTSKTTVDLVSTKITPVLDSSLCGHREYVIGGPLRGEINLQRLKLTPFEVTLQSGYAVMKYQTSKRKPAAVIKKLADELNTLTLTDLTEGVKDPNYPYYVNDYSIKGKATVPAQPEGSRARPDWPLYTVERGAYMNNDMLVSIDYGGGIRVELPEIGSAFTKTYYYTCYRAPYFVSDIKADPNSLKAVYYVSPPKDRLKGWQTSEQAWLEVSGSAMFSNKTADRFIREPTRKVQFTFWANLLCGDPLPYWKIREPLDPGKEQIDLGAEIGETGNSTVDVDEALTTITTGEDETGNSTNSTKEGILITLPIGGMPTQVEVGMPDGEGEMIDDLPIFGRPPVAQPFFKAIINMTLQNSDSADYDIGKIAEGEKIYVDRPYTWTQVPKFLQNMTTIMPSNDDTRWPGSFNKYSDDNLFCMMTKLNTPAIYVIMDADMLITPYWVSEIFELLETVEVHSSSGTWDDRVKKYYVFWRRTNGYRHHCFGLNGAEADNMYAVAFGAEPPPELLTFGEDDEDKWQWTLEKGYVRINFVNNTCIKVHGNLNDPTDTSNAKAKFRTADGKNCTSDFTPTIKDVHIEGIIGLKVGLVTSRVPIVIDLYGDLSRMRFKAYNVQVTSFKNTLASVAPPEETGGSEPVFAESAREERQPVSSRGRMRPRPGTTPSTPSPTPRPVRPGPGTDTGGGSGGGIPCVFPPCSSPTPVTTRQPTPGPVTPTPLPVTRSPTKAPTPTPVTVTNAPTRRGEGGGGQECAFPPCGDVPYTTAPTPKPYVPPGSTTSAPSPAPPPNSRTASPTVYVKDVILREEIEEMYRGNFTFSTYPEDIGITFEMNAVMSMSNQLGAAVKNAKFRIECYIPFGYNYTSNNFLPGNSSLFTFKLQGHAEEIITESKNVLKNVDVFLWARDKWLTAKFDSDLYIGFSDNTTLATHVAFDIPAFNMRNPNTTTPATFNGTLIEPYMPKRADWVTFTGGGIYGKADLSLNEFILKELKLQAIAAFDTSNSSRLDGITGSVLLMYRRPGYYMIDMRLTVLGNYQVMEIAERSSGLDQKSLTYVNGTSAGNGTETVSVNGTLVQVQKSAELQLRVKLATQGEYLRLEVRGKSEITPTFLATDEIYMEMIFSATEQYLGSNHSIYYFSLACGLNQLEFTDFYKIKNFYAQLEATLSEDKPDPVLNLTMRGMSEFTFASNATSPLKVNTTMYGTYSPHLNLTTVDGNLDLHDIWMITPQVALTKGKIHAYGEHRGHTGNWTFDPIAYAANGQMQLTDAKDTNIILVSTTGMYDVHGGDSYCIVSASLGGNQPFTLLLPSKANDTLPSAKDVTMMEATFDMCVSTKTISKKPIQNEKPAIAIRPTPDGKGLEVVVPPVRERPPPRDPPKPRPAVTPDNGRPSGGGQECAFPPCRRLQYHGVYEDEAPPQFDFWKSRSEHRMEPRYAHPIMRDNFEPHIYDTHNIYDYLDHGIYSPESDALKITIKALRNDGYRTMKHVGNEDPHEYFRVLRGEETTGGGQECAFPPCDTAPVFSLPGEVTTTKPPNSDIPLRPDTRPEPVQPTTPSRPARGEECAFPPCQTVTPSTPTRPGRPGTTPTAPIAGCVPTREKPCPVVDIIASSPPAVPNKFKDDVPGVGSNIDCIDGVVVKVVILAQPSLLTYLSPFGDNAVNASVGMSILGIFPTDANNTIAINTTFLGEGLMLAPSVYLNKVFIVTQDLNKQVDYIFEIEWFITNSNVTIATKDTAPAQTSLMLIGHGSFGKEKSTKLELQSYLTDSLWIRPNIEIHPTCDIKIKMEATSNTGKNKNVTEWEAGEAKLKNCAATIYIENTTSSIYALTNGKVDAVDSSYVFTIGVNFTNMVEGISAVMGISEDDSRSLLPPSLDNVTMEMSSQSQLYVNSKIDKLRFRTACQITAVWELVSVLETLGIEPSTVDMFLEIETSLTNPMWNNTDIRFKMKAKDFWLGPIEVESLELGVDRTSNGDLKIVASSVFIIFDQHFRAIGQTNFTSAETSMRVEAELMYDPDNIWNIMFDCDYNITDKPRADEWKPYCDCVNITAGKAFIDLDKNITLDRQLKLANPDSDGANFTVTTAWFDGTVNVRYSDTIKFKHNVYVEFLEDLKFYYVRLRSMQVYSIADFLPAFPSANFSVGFNSKIELSYHSKTNLGMIKLDGRLKSEAVFEPLEELLPELRTASIDTTWDMELATDFNKTWWFKGLFKLNNTKIGDKFTIENGMLRVHFENDKNVSWGFDVNSCYVITDSFLAGANETIVATLGGSYSTETKILQLRGGSREPFHPIGNTFLQVERAAIVIDIVCPSNYIERFESIAYMTTTFTNGVFTGEYVCLRDGADCFVRAQNISILNLESAFDGVYNETVNPDAVARLDPVMNMHLDDVDMYVSNFVSARYGIHDRGLSIIAKGRLEENCTLVETIKGVAVRTEDILEPGEDPELMELKFKVKFTVDLFAGKNESRPTIYLRVDGKNIEVMPNIDILSFEFECVGLLKKMEFQIELSTTVKIDIIGLRAPLITTLKGDFDLEVINGTVHVQDDWTAMMYSRLGQDFSWDPMGMAVFYLNNPEMELYFSNNEDTPENDIEVDKMVLRAKNFTVNEYMMMLSPEFTVRDFGPPQSFGLESGLKIQFQENNTHPLWTQISGSYEEGNCTHVNCNRYTQFNFSSVTQADWWPFGHNMIVVEQNALINFQLKLDNGELDQLRMMSRFDVTFDPLGKSPEETMRVFMKGKSNKGVSEFCWMIYDIPIFTIQRVFMNIFVGENGTEACENFLLSDDGAHGVSLDVDKRMLNETTGEYYYEDYNFTYIDHHKNYTTRMDLGSYNQQCEQYMKRQDMLAGHRIRLKIKVGPDSKITQLWKLIDYKTHEVFLDLELLYPNQRSAAAPLSLRLELNNDYYAVPGMTTDCKLINSTKGYIAKAQQCTNRAKDGKGVTICTTEQDNRGVRTCECENAADVGVSTGNAKILMEMIDPSNRDVHMILISFDFRIKIGTEGKSLGFEVSGRAEEIMDDCGGDNAKLVGCDTESGKSPGAVAKAKAANETRYKVDLHGALREPWKAPFNISWLSIDAATLDVSTTSDMSWNETRFFMYCDATFAFNSTARIRISAEISNGGDDFTMVARLTGSNIMFMHMLGGVSGADDISKTTVGQYLKETQSSEDIYLTLSTVNNVTYESGFDIIGKGIRKGLTFKLNLLNYNRTIDDAISPDDSPALNNMIGAFVGARSSLDLEIWVGFFHEYKTVPPMSIGITNKGANLVFADGLVTVVDWKIFAKFNSARSAWPWLEAHTTIIFRPDDGDEIKLIAGGSPMRIYAEMYGIWYSPFDLQWLDVANLGVSVEFQQNTTDWFVVDRLKFHGTAIIGFTFAGRLTAEFLRDAEGSMINFMYLRMQFFYEVQKNPAKMVDEVLGPDVPDANGTAALLTLGENTCGSIKIPLPTVTINKGAKGNDVVFLQQLLEDLQIYDHGTNTYFSTSDAKVFVGKFDDATNDAVIQYKFDNGMVTCEACFNGGEVNPAVWRHMCKAMEIKKGIVVGGKREWMSDFRFPGFLDNMLWDMTYSTFDKYDGDMSFQKGIQIVANVNVREMGNLDVGLSMLNYVNNYDDTGGYSPLLQAGIHIPIFDAHPEYIRAWIEANQFSVYTDVVWCNTVRLQLQIGNPPRLEIHGNVDLTFEDTPRLNVDIWAKFALDGSMAELQGRVKTRWEFADGIYLREAGISIGIFQSKGVDMATGSMHADIGLACKLEIGPVIIFFTGKGGITELGLPSTAMLLYGGLKGAGNDGFGLVLSVRDLAIWWVDDVMEEKDGKIWQFDPRDIGEEWGLYDTFFQISTMDIEMFGVRYPPGFAFSTGLHLFGIDCSICMAIVWEDMGDGNMMPDFKFDVQEGLEAAEEMSRRKLLEEILPDGLVDPSMLTSDQRKVKEKDDGLSFELPFFQMDKIELKNINFLTLATGGRPILRIKFKFFGVKQTLDIELWTIQELYEMNLWDKLNAFYHLVDTLFSLPDCMWDSHCYNPDNYYCDAICDDDSPMWYGDCPDKSGQCNVNDKDCVACFGECWMFQCKKHDRLYLFYSFTNPLSSFSFLRLVRQGLKRDCAGMSVFKDVSTVSGWETRRALRLCIFSLGNGEGMAGTGWGGKPGLYYILNRHTLQELN
jgi:hypothetical protein